MVHVLCKKLKANACGCNFTTRNTIRNSFVSRVTFLLFDFGTSKGKENRTSTLPTKFYSTAAMRRASIHLLANALVEDAHQEEFDTLLNLT